MGVGESLIFIFLECLIILFFILFFIISIIIYYKLSSLKAEYSYWKSKKMKKKKIKHILKSIEQKIKDSCNNGKYDIEISDYNFWENDLFNNEETKNYIKNQLELKGYEVLFDKKNDFFGEIRYMKISWR